MKYYIIAGEASGDLHGSNLIRALKKQDPGAVIRGWGGDLMISAGADVVKHYKDLAFMGFIEVARNLGTILRNLRFCKEDIIAFEPDLLILVDYAGFNLRIAKWAHPLNYKIVFYISPQVWAWKENRVKAIRENVDKMLVILPFEKEFYKKWNFEVEYVGHPLVEVIEAAISKGVTEKLSDRPVIALLPGSRQQEINKKLPVMLQVADAFPGYQFIVAKAPGLSDIFYENFFTEHKNVSAVANQTYNLLLQSEAALVTSGTATLETALFAVPEIVCYKGSPVSYLIAKQLIKVKYISLVNLIMDKEVVKELIQDEMNAYNLKRELTNLLNNSARRAELKRDYDELKALLKQGGDASTQAAAIITHFLMTGR